MFAPLDGSAGVAGDCGIGMDLPRWRKHSVRDRAHAGNLLRRTAWRIRDALGRRRQFSILVEILRLESGVNIETAVGRGALVETNGTKVWIFDDEDLNRVGPFRREDKIASPRIVTAGSAQGSMFIGSSIDVDGTNKPVGIDMKVLPRWRGGNTDLTLAFASTEVLTNQAAKVEVVTNTMFALRVQLPVGKRVFAVAKGPAGKPAALVSAALPTEK